MPNKVPFQNVDFDELSYATGDVHGHKLEVDVYRAEITGILASINFTNETCKKYGISEGTCRLYCDNKGAISATFGHKRPTPRWASYDLIRQIKQAIMTSPIKWQGIHVLGHQDKDLEFKLLDLVAQGNVLVDHMANQHLLQNERRADEPTKLTWIPYIGEQTVSGNTEKTIINAIYRPRMILYWSSVFVIPNSMQTLCNWDLYFRSIRTQNPRDRYTIMKYNTRILPVGKNLKRRKHANHDACPCCGEYEDHDHLIQCTHPEMEQAYNAHLEIIHTFLLQDASVEIRTGIMQILRLFRKGVNLNDSHDYSAIVSWQYETGMRAFMAGLWLREWSSIQSEHFSELCPRRSSDLWLIRLMHLVQSIPRYMWKTRNQILHRSSEDNIVLQTQHKELDEIIDNIYERKPHQRLMSHCDVSFFRKYDKDKVKKFKVKRKTNWVTSANLILTKYERAGTTEQSKRFLSFFQWDRG